MEISTWKMHIPVFLNRYGWLAVFGLLIALECVPFWMFQFFPSQDGPSHLYNAAVVANYGKEAVYQSYYSLHLPLAGNVAPQALLVGLLKLKVPPYLAEKLLMTAYAAMLPLCLWYLLDHVSSHANVFSLFGVLLIPNFFLHMGFWNFCISIPLMLFALGYYLRRRDAWSFPSIVTLALLGAIVYITHMVAWGVFAIAVAVCEVANRLSVAAAFDTTILTRWRHLIPLRSVVLSTLIPPGVSTLVYALTTHRSQLETLSVPESFQERAWTVYSLSFLHTLSASDLAVTKITAALFGLIGIAVLIFRFRWARHLGPTDVFVVLSAICASLALLGPDAVGDGSYIPMRVALFGWLFLIMWFAVQQWPAWMIRVLWSVIPIMLAGSLLARLPDYRRWDSVLKEFRSLGGQIRPGATVLSLNTQRTGGSIDPLFHAVDLFVPRPFIDLRNYEASTDHFLTCFRRDHSPYDALGNLAELNHIPAVFDIARYEKQALGRVDYVLLYALPRLAQGTGEADQYYEAQLRGYHLIYASKAPLKALLYMRSQNRP